jgi:hypothetical protein
MIVLQVIEAKSVAVKESKEIAERVEGNCSFCGQRLPLPLAALQDECKAASGEFNYFDTLRAP